jgi:hypothetical protein
MTMTSFYFQTHVSDSGVITLPLDARDFYGEIVSVNVDRNAKPKREISLDEICGGWRNDERTTEEIIRDIYESRTIGREREPL